MQVNVRKRLAERLTCFWPGLPRLWWDGNWVGLVVASTFAILLNFLLLTSFIWSEPLATFYLYLGWAIAAVIWVVATGEAIHADGKRAEIPAERADEALFLQAQTEYLKGHWFKAEQLLQGILDDFPGDADSRLMLATLYRHTNRPNLAKRQLDLLQRGDGNDKWQMEIEQEKLLLSEAESGEPTDGLQVNAESAEAA